MREFLLILPCSKGIAQGDYLKSKSWQNVFNILRAYGVNFDKIQFGAVDHIITIFDPKRR